MQLVAFWPRPETEDAAELLKHTSCELPTRTLLLPLKPRQLASGLQMAPKA